MIDIDSMIVELKPEEFPGIQHLFPDVHLRLMIDGMVAGNSPARVWTDDAGRPRSAYIWDNRYCHYLAGSDRNETFNGSVARLLEEEIKPEVLSQGRRIYKVYYTPSSWEKIAVRILDEVLPIRAKRCLYRFEKQSVPGSAYETPPGFLLAPIDGKLLADRTLGNVEDVTSEINSCWSSIEAFLENGFGFCVRNREEIACWCTAEYVSEGKCGIGVETVEGYRKRGFASLATSALVEHCIESGIAAHWDCWADNVPSVKTAESLTFTKIMDYNALLGSFDEFEGLIIRANDLYRRGEYRESARAHEKALRIVGQEAEPYFFYNAACALAKAGETERALMNLEIAVKRGWKDLQRLESSETLEPLRGSGRWRRLIASLEAQNA
jgi:RimJ/RimL family protein N-acetyltransferase